MNEVNTLKSISISHPDINKKNGYKLDHKFLLDLLYMGKVLCSLPITANASLALKFLIEYYQKYGEMRVSLEETREHTQLKTRSAVKKMMDKLVKQGFLFKEVNKERKKGRKTHRYLASCYHFTSLGKQLFEIECVKRNIQELDKKIKARKRKEVIEKLEEEKTQKLEALASLDHLCFESKKEIDGLFVGEPLPLFPVKKNRKKQKVPVEVVVRESLPVVEKKKVVRITKSLGFMNILENLELLEHNLSKIIYNRRPHERRVFEERARQEIRETGCKFDEIALTITSEEKFQEYVMQ